MSAMPQKCENPCETCAKEGLPLLLTRYALMPSETGAPRLSGTLDDPALSQVPLGQGAHYGLRLLRSGYVYVYDEARKHFDEYFVTADGFLTKMPPRIWAFKQQHTPATEFRCARNGSAPMAGVITIRNPKHASKVWIAFSNAEWTKALFDQHQDEAHRAKHMRCITISGGKVAPQAGTAPIEQLQQHVPEFKMEQTRAAKAFAKFSPHDYNGRQQSASALLQAVQEVRPQGGAAIVALQDPTALVQEIAGLMELRKNTFINHDSVLKPRFAASTIASLEHSIKEQAKLEELAAAERVATDMAVNGGVANLLPSYRAIVDKTAQVTPAQLSKVANEKWAQYTHDRTGKPRFDAQGSRTWLKDYNDQLHKLDTEHIAPLAKAHVAWLKHPRMVSHMACNFDSADKSSGAAYTATVAQTLRLTSDKQPSYDQYKQWLQAGDVNAAQNLVMRALCFNQEQLIGQIKKADLAPLDGRAFPSDMLLSYAKDLMEKMPPGAQASMAELLQSVGGALFSNLDHTMKGGASARALASVAAVAGVQFTTVEVKGNRGKFVQHMMRSLMQIDPNLSVKPNELGRAVAAQLRLMEAEGMAVNKVDKRRWLVVLDRSAAQQTAKQALRNGQNGDALAEALSKSMRSADNLPSLKAEAFKGGVNGSAFGAGAAFMTGLVQSYNFVKLVSDYTDGMKHEKDEASKRLAAGAVAILGTFGEATGHALQKIQEVRLRNAPGMNASIVPNYLKTIGRRLGLGAGLVMAGLDLMKWASEDQKGDSGLARAYLATGLLSFGLSIAFYFSASIPFIGWIVVGLAVIALFVLTAWIEKNKDNKVQEWLMRCHFGTHTDKYKTEAEEASELQKAFA
jgi:hypothetical protein